MAFNLFDPPQTKAHKRAAIAACGLRELAGRDAGIEVHMLGNRHSHGVSLFRANARRAADDDAMNKLGQALEEAKSVILRTNHFADTFLQEISNLRGLANNASDYEDLTSFELEGRGALIAIRNDARTTCNMLGVVCLNFQATIAADVRI